MYGLEDFITMRHLENMAKVMLVTGLIVAYGYAMEAFFGWYSANQYEQFMIMNRMTGPYCAVLLVADPLQRRRAAAALVQAASGTTLGVLFVDLRCSSTSACGSSGSSSSSRACTATSCPSSWGMYYADDLGLA